MLLLNGITRNKWENVGQGDSAFCFVFDRKSCWLNFSYDLCVFGLLKHFNCKVVEKADFISRFDSMWEAIFCITLRCGCQFLYFLLKLFRKWHVLSYQVRTGKVDNIAVEYGE